MNNFAINIFVPAALFPIFCYIFLGCIPRNGINLIYNVESLSENAVAIHHSTIKLSDYFIADHL